MKGGYLKVTVSISDEKGVGTETDAQDITHMEMLACIGTLAADVARWGNYDIETVIRAVRDCYYNDF